MTIFSFLLNFSKNKDIFLATFLRCSFSKNSKKPFVKINFQKVIISYSYYVVTDVLFQKMKKLFIRFFFQNLMIFIVTIIQTRTDIKIIVSKRFSKQISCLKRLNKKRSESIFKFNNRF